MGLVFKYVPEPFSEQVPKKDRKEVVAPNWLSVRDLSLSPEGIVPETLAQELSVLCLMWQSMCELTVQSLRHLVRIVE